MSVPRSIATEGSLFTRGEGAVCAFRRDHQESTGLSRSYREGSGLVGKDLSSFPIGREHYALANSFRSALLLRNHGRSRRCMYRGSVRFFASSFCAHSRASSRRFAVLRKLA